jgi:hypothetical protein
VLSWVSWNGKLLWPVVLPKYFPSANLLFFQASDEFVGRVEENKTPTFFCLFGYLRSWHMNRAKNSGEWVDQRIMDFDGGRAKD